MATFRRADETVSEIVIPLMQQHYGQLLEAKVRIDYVFAFGETDDVSGELISDALKKNGCKALGLTRKIPLKDRALGRGDAEIAIDGDWWGSANDQERRALMDHELYHIVLTEKRDDLGRPVLKLRPHDYEFGWFEAVAARNGIASQERKQASLMMEKSGQFFWPFASINTDKQEESTRFQKIEAR